MSLRNSVKRREHRERSQPAARKGKGLLEKKRDWKARATDAQRKRAAVTKLQHKADDRNPDEFYFAMQRGKTRGGVHVVPTAEANKYTQAELALMRTQDIGYLRTRAQAEARKQERLQSALHFVGAGKPASHQVFCDGEDAVKAFDPAQHLDTPAALLARTYNRPRHAQLEAAGVPDQGVAADSQGRARRARGGYRELAGRAARQAQLRNALARKELEQATSGKGRKRKLSAAQAGTEQPVFRWKQERKK